MIQQNGYMAIQHIRVRINHNIISTVNLVQGDTAREFHFFFDDYIIPEGAEFRVYVRKPSGCEIYNHCQLRNNEIIVQPTLQMVAEKGQNLGQIQIIKDDKLLNTFVFYLAIEENLIFSSSITSSNEFELINNYLEIAKNKIPELLETLDIARQNNTEFENAENIRKANEDTRISNESIRIDNENTRIANENERITNENTRQENENKRKTDTETIINACDDAKNSANKAAKDANDLIKDIQQKFISGYFTPEFEYDSDTGDLYYIVPDN